MITSRTITSRIVMHLKEMAAIARKPIMVKREARQMSMRMMISKFELYNYIVNSLK